MIKTMTTVAASVIVCAAATAGQSPFAWEASYSGPNAVEDYGNDVSVDQAGNVYVVGETQGQGTGFDLVLVKYDRRGDQVWSRTYDHEGLDDHGFLVEVDAFGNVIAAGDSVSAGTGYDLVVLKYDRHGNQLWERRYDGPGHDFDGTSMGRSMALDHAGNIVIACTSYGAGTDYDAATLKYSPAGTLLWERRFNGPANSFDDCYSVAIDASDNVYVGGDTYSVSGSYDFAVLKYDANGNLAWVRTYDGPDHRDETAYSIAVDAAANVYLTGLSEGLQTEADIATVKWDASGGFAWARHFDGGGNGSDLAFAIAVTAQGDVVTVGEGIDQHGWGMAFAIAYDTSGLQKWVRSYQDPMWIGTNSFTDVAFDDHGNACIAGWTWAGFPQSMNGMLFKYAPDGALVWERHFDGAMHGADAVFSIDLDHKGNVYAAGIVFGSDLSPDALALKCGVETTGIGNATLK